MAFVDEVGYYAGSTSGKNTEISKFLANGVQWVINQVEKTNPDMMQLFASLQTLNNSSPTLTLSTNAKILDIVRDSADSGGEDLKCSPINPAFRSNAENTNSLYYASVNSPVYYILNGVLTVLPTPTANQTAKISIVLPDTSVAHSDSAIDNFPSELYHAVILYAAGQLIHNKMAATNAKLPNDLDSDASVFNDITDLSTSISVSADLPASFNENDVGAVPSLDIQSSLPSEFTDAMATVKALTQTDKADDDGASAESALYWLNDEDEDMTQATLNTAASELQRANAWLTKYQNDINKEVQEFTVDMQTYQAKIAEESSKSGINSTKFQNELTLRQAQASEALAEFNANVQKKITLYTTVIGKLTTDYQWLQGQLQTVKAELYEFMAPYTTGGALDSTVEGVKR
tara:strand:- start:472 stop:1683 length:1212 start_codon:yes stop_codon:yes gene_type:complete